jgi:nitrogen regulatory protein P-II 2
MIEAILPPQRLDAVKEALAEVNIFRLTVIDSQGLARMPAGRRTEEAESPRRRIKLIIAVADEAVSDAVSAVRRARGDEVAGGLYVNPLEDVVRIRTGERGEEAL